MDEAAAPYWSTRANVAPIKSEYVLWDRVNPSGSSSARTGNDGELPAPKEMDDDDAAEGRAETGEKVSDLSRSNEEPPRKKQKGGGMNKGRTFARVRDDGERLCLATTRGLECPTHPENSNVERPCNLSHDLAQYLADNKADDIILSRPDAPSEPVPCPLFTELGLCPFGFKCRFLSSHLVKHENGEGFQGTGLTLAMDLEKLQSKAPASLTSEEERLKWVYDLRGEMNVVGSDAIRRVRNAKSDATPITKAYLKSIGEPIDSRVGGQDRGVRGGRGGRGRGRGGKQRGRDGGWAGRDAKQLESDAHSGDAKTEEQLGESSAQPPQNSTDTFSRPGIDDPVDVSSANRDTPDVPLRAVEKKRLHFEGGLYLAPLTTVGNLPFRRLCVQYGADITCGEMGLAQEFQTGNKSEWSLIRRHPSERKFGIQLCGNRPQTLVAATEAICKEVSDLDFIDVNLGCPIDLVVKKGAGSALLDHAGKLGKILKGMSFAAGDVPITIKMRTGIKTGVNTTHKLMPRAVKDWGVGALTIHGRTQQQRYSKSADYDYIRTCVGELRRAAEEIDVPSIPIFGNGDAYDHRSYWQNVEETGVDGIMVARGALIKPWLFTELKERRDWDISSRERLDMIGNLAKYGLEHWGSDTMGVNNTRRFLCEALSFTYRYVPVGLLETLPARLNDRPYPFKGRDELETLLASGNAADWVKISSMFLGPPPPEFQFVPKHKSNAYDTTESNG